MQLEDSVGCSHTYANGLSPISQLRPREVPPNHDEADREGLWDLPRSHKSRRQPGRGRREQKPRQKVRNLGTVGWLQSHNLALTGTNGFTGTVSVESALTGKPALTGIKGLTGFDLDELALTGTCGPHGQNVQRRKACMTVEVLSGSSELPSQESRQP